MSHYHSSSSSSSSASSSSSINALLKKTEHYDKDERYMATSDLCELLKRPMQGANSTGDGTRSGATAARSSSTHTTQHKKLFDATTERKICTAVLRLLHDKSNDVQAVAVKTLGVLLQTVPQELVLDIADSLTDQVLDSGKSKLRDVYSIGLRTLVQTIPTSMGDATSKKLIGRLLEGIRTSVSSSSSSTTRAMDDATQEEETETVRIAKKNEQQQQEEIVLSCLDVLTDLLGRFGATSVSVTRQHEPVLQICLQLIVSSSSSSNTGSSSSPVIRKRAGTALGCLSVVLSDALLVSAVERLLTRIEENNENSKRNKKNNTNNNSDPDTDDIENKENTRALIRTMCTISGAVGHRLQQPQIDRIIPIFLTFTDPEEAQTGDDDEDTNDNADTGTNDHDDDDDDAMHDDCSQDIDESAVQMANELRESCFMGFESFVQKCPTQVEPHLDKIVQAALAYMSYDPNYSYGIDADGMKNDDTKGDDDEYGDDEYSDEEEYGDDDDDDFYDDDDDDESWKVRRAAIRSLLAVVQTKKFDPGFLWSKSYVVRKRKEVECVAAALVGRFKEREENCRVDILETFTVLLDVTIQEIGSDHNTTLRFSAPSSSSSEEEDTTMMEEDNDTDVIVDLAGNYAPAVVKGCEKLMAMKKGGERSKSKALSLISTLCTAPGGVGGHAEILSVFQHVQTILGKGADDDDDHTTNVNASSKALRLDALSLIVAMLESDTHNPDDIRAGLATVLLPQLCSATKEHWYKVIAEALRALASVPKFFGTANNGGSKKETADVANQLFDSIEPLLKAHDVDQELKECALLATSSLMSELHGQLQKKQITRLSELLLERLKNETTRIPAIKTFSSICSSPKGKDIDFATGANGILGPAIETMSGFLKMQSRSLRQTSLEALDVIITSHGSMIKPKKFATKLYSSLLEELSDLVVDADLHLSHLGLYVPSSSLHRCS